MHSTVVAMPYGLKANHTGTSQQQSIWASTTANTTTLPRPGLTGNCTLKKA